MKQSILLFSLIVLSWQSSSAQFSIGSDVSMMYDDNINNNSLQLRDNVTTLAGNLRYDWEGERWEGNVSYDGALSYFQRYIDRSNQSHGLSGQYFMYSGVDNENALRISVSAGTGIFRGGYSFYDHSAFSASLDYKYFLSESIINKFGYNFRSYSFSNASGFSYNEHLVYGHLAFALPTNTTVISQFDVGTKYYSDDLSVSSGSKGRLSSISPDVAQAIGIVRVGQRVSDVIGLSASMRYQWNLLKQSRYLIDEDGYLVSDDELFDDHYGYEGLHSSLTYSHILTETMVAKVTGGYLNKVYSLLPAYDSGGNMINDQRKDGRLYMNILFEKEFTGLGFSLKTSFDIISQSSNDPYYDYLNKAVSFEISLPF